MLINMVGEVFGSLTVISRESNARDGTARWLCLCLCGETRVVEGTGLRAGRNKSCGCKSSRFQSTKYPDHEMKGTRTYKIWIVMIHRCHYSKKSKDLRNYRWKGIAVCDEWISSFDAFYADMGEAPEGMSIDRIDGSKGYSPENSRWATPREQANNTARNRLITINGDTRTVSQWAEYTKQKPNTITTRLRRGWTELDSVYPQA